MMFPVIVAEWFPKIALQLSSCPEQNQFVSKVVYRFIENGARQDWNYLVWLADGISIFFKCFPSTNFCFCFTRGRSF